MGAVGAGVDCVCISPVGVVIVATGKVVDVVVCVG